MLQVERDVQQYTYDERTYCWVTKDVGNGAVTRIDHVCDDFGKVRIDRLGDPESSDYHILTSSGLSIQTHWEQVVKVQLWMGNFLVHLARQHRDLTRDKWFMEALERQAQAQREHLSDVVTLRIDPTRVWTETYKDGKQAYVSSGYHLPPINETRGLVPIALDEMDPLPVHVGTHIDFVTFAVSAADRVFAAYCGREFLIDEIVAHPDTETLPAQIEYKLRPLLMPRGGNEELVLPSY